MLVLILIAFVLEFISIYRLFMSIQRLEYLNSSS
jgi:hypothetical protein